MSARSLMLTLVLSAPSAAQELGAACEYWNAGVEGYSTLQELEYYRRYLAGIQADHVVLVFHLNDFVTTPVTLRDGERIISVRERRKVLNAQLAQFVD